MFLKSNYNIKDIFNNISYRYDFLNNLFSLGLHNIWKKKLVRILNPINGEAWADLCCGTGDLSIIINKRVYPDGSILAIDNASQILKIARKKSKNLNNNFIIWKEKDIFEIDESFYKFDGICMSYGLRNLYSAEEGLKKVFSLLKENGRAGFLDFNHTKEKSFSAYFQKYYLRYIVVPISGFFNLKKEYSYIEKSIEKFPNGKNLILIAKKIGFKEVKFKTICGGQMCFLIIIK